MDSRDQLDKNEQVMQYLMKLCEKYGYRVIQANGQRIYSPPESMEIPVPPKGSEIFIGKLRKDMFEDEIIPLLEQIAQLYKFRLMLDFTGKNRGFAFATYYNPEYAQKAVKEFDNYEIRPNVRIGVCRSVDNCTLYIGNLPRDKSKSDIFDLMADASDDVMNVILHSDQVNKHLNRGYAFVEFKDHRSAAIVRRRFTPKNLYAWDRFLSVDWAEPEPEVDPHIMENVKILIIRQLPYEITTKDLSERIYEYLDKLLIDKVSKTEDFAFVHFITREAAEIGLDLLKTHLKYQGCNIEIEFSKPPEYSKGHRVAAVEPNNFCFYGKVMAFMKKQNVDYVPKKSKILSLEECKKFIIEASDDFLLCKVVLIFGLYGACRRDELIKLTVDDIEDHQKYILVKLQDTKTHAPRSFVVPDSNSSLNPYSVYKKYAELRPHNVRTNRFFLGYKGGKCFVQPAGIHTIGGVPRKVATFLGLESPEKYTGHCLRRSGASMVAEASGSVLPVKQIGGWKSSKVAEGYIEQSLKGKMEVANMILSTPSAPKNVEKNYLDSVSNCNLMKLNMASSASAGLQIKENSNCTINIQMCNHNTG